MKYLAILLIALTFTGCTNYRTVSEFERKNDIQPVLYHPKADGTIERVYIYHMRFANHGHPSLGGPSIPGEHTETHQQTVIADKDGKIISRELEVVSWGE